MFHAFTGCDTVSFFGGRGKKTAWDTWKEYHDATSAFCALVSTPSLETVEEVLDKLETFVVLLYDRTSNQQCVDEARKQLFTQKGRAIDGLPPTQAALILHIKRATYQAGHCWAQMTTAVQIFHHQMIGAGTRKLREAGKQGGQLYRKLQRLVGN